MYIERATKDKKNEIDIDIFSLLHCSQTHNAKQLAQFCLHFIATNYQQMSKRPEFQKLTGEDLKYVEG